MNSKIDKKDLVSIVMPAFNCEKFISLTLDSVIKQTYQNWEVIVIDDCSTDGTAKVVQKYIKKDTRIKYYKLERNSGTALARNKAIDMAMGKYIAFLDSDDTWEPEKLTKQVNFMDENNFHFTCTSYKKIDEQGKYLNKTIFSKTKSSYNDILRTCPGNSTVMYNAEKLGKFKIHNIRKRNDYVLWLQIIKKEKYLHGIPEPLSSHRIRNESISSNKTSLIKYHWKIYREIEKLSLSKSCGLLLYWITVTVFRLR